MPFFRKSDVRTECDACGYRFDIVHGGVCARCRRILCYSHLHGSWIQRVRVDLGGEAVCVDCRRQGRASAPAERAGREAR